MSAKGVYLPGSCIIQRLKYWSSAPAAWTVHHRSAHTTLLRHLHKPAPRPRSSARLKICRAAYQPVISIGPNAREATTLLMNQRSARLISYLAPVDFLDESLFTSHDLLCQFAYRYHKQLTATSLTSARCRSAFTRSCTQIRFTAQPQVHNPASHAEYEVAARVHLSKPPSIDEESSTRNVHSNHAKPNRHRSCNDL